MRVITLICGCLWLCLLLSAPAWAAPTAADQAFVAARQLFRTENDAQAIVELKKFVAAYPADPRVHEANYMLGCSYQRTGQLAPALAAFTQVTRRATAPEQARLRADTHFQMGDCYLQQGEYASAVQSFDNALKLVTDDAEFIAQALYWKASALYQLGRGADAMPVFTRVAEVAPTHPLASWSLYAVGVIALEAGDAATAITTLDGVMTRYKDAEVAGEARLKLAQAYAERGRATTDAAAATADLRKAVPLFQAVIGMADMADDSRLRAVLGLAQVHNSLNEFDKAIAVCAQALAKADPANVDTLEIRLTRADAAYNAKRFADAAADYATVADNKIAAEHALRGRYWQGNALFQQAQEKKDGKLYAAAAAAFGRFLDAAGTKHALAPRAALLIGLCHEERAALGDAAARASAVDAFKQVSAKWPESREAAEAQARIAAQAETMPITELEKLAGTLPPGPTAWGVMLQLARAQFLADQFTDAAATAQKLLAAKPDADTSARAAYLAAVSLTRQNRSKEAIPYYKQVQASAQAGELTVPAQRGLIQAYLLEKQFTEARDAAKSLVALPIDAAKPVEREAELADRLMLLAQALIGTQQYPDALDAYARTIKECPTSPQVPYALMGSAWVAETRKDLPAANAQYRMVIERHPKHELCAEARFRLGANLVELKEYEQAIAALRQVPADYALADEAAYKIAWAYRSLGKADDANAKFTAITEQFPKSPLAGASFFHLGEAAMEKEQYRDAQPLLTRALELMASDYTLRPLATMKLGACAYHLNDFARAATLFGALAADDRAGDLAAEGLFWRAKALESQPGQAGTARDAYARYVAKYPAGELVLDAQLGAGRAALAAKQYAPARADLQKALDLCPQYAEKSPALAERAKSVQPEAQYLLGMTAMEEKKYEEALRLLAAVSAYNLEPWYSRSLLQMARCSAMSGNNAAAEKTLDLLKKSFPNSDAVRQIPQVVEELKLTVN